jgi:FkbM family methyltransferase
VPDIIQRQFGVLRSLAIYYAPGKIRRLRHFYSQFVASGDLCFDIGAHVGNRVAAWRQLGALVVAVEPQSVLFNWLSRFYRSSPEVTLVRSAVGSHSGHGVLRSDPLNPTVSTLSDDWIATVGRDASFAGVRWRESEPVAVTTLDKLIAEYGRPVLCKVDVEGYEAEALRGLSVPLQVVAFEFIPAAIGVARDCILRLEELGDYEYNWFPGESHNFVSPGWLKADEMIDRLDRPAGNRESGDVFARRISVPD